jgi:uncharacterized protein YkwD
MTPIVLLALAACQTPQPGPTATAVAPPLTSAPPVATEAPPAVATEPPPAPTEIPPAPSPTSPPAPPSTPPSEPATLETGDAYVTAEGGLNIRSEASAAATLLQTLALGTHLATIGQPTAPDAAGIIWQNVQTDDGQSGWVSAQYLSSARPAPSPGPPPSAEPASPTITHGFVYVASVGGLNMRAGSSVSSLILTRLADGQRLQTNGLTVGPDENGITWLNVKTEDGVEGWVSAEFVSEQVPSVAPAAPPANLPDAVAEILRRANELRQSRGLPPYILNDDLNRLALMHSQYMSQNGITHVDGSGLSARHRITNAGYGAGRPTENIFGGQASVDDAWAFWSTSPPHLDNLLNTFNNVIGIGVFEVGVRTFYTLNFGKPAERRSTNDC